MKVSDDLYLLIRSMSKSEKRHFKLFTSFHAGDKKYVQLFDAMDKLKEYDEKKLKQLFEGERFLIQFSVAKNYLYKLIMKSLGMFQCGKTRSSELRDLLDQVEVLYKKGLYEQATKLLEKAKNIAIRYEKNTLLADILRWERIMYRLLRNGEKLKTLPQEFSEVIRKLKNTNDYQDIETQLWLLFGKKGKVRTSTDRKEFDHLHRHKLLNNESLALTTESKWFYYNAQVLYYRVTGNYEKAYLPGQKLVELIESVPGMKQEEINTYVSSIGNFIIVLMELRKTDECLSTIKKLRALGADKSVSGYSNILPRIFTNSYVQELDLYIVTGDYANAEKIIPAIEQGLVKHQAEITQYEKMTFYYLISNTYLSTGKFRKALHWLNKVMDGAAIRPDYQPMARMLNMIIHFELKNTDILDYVIKSTYRFLKKKEKLFKFEMILLDSIKKLPRIDTDKQLAELFKDLRKNLSALRNDPYEKMALEYFDLIAWLDQKVANLK